MVQDLLHPKSGGYVICKYDDKVWVAFISTYDEEFYNFKVKFLYPSGHNKYYCYSEIEDLPFGQKIFFKMAATSLKLGTQRIQYCFKQKK